MQYYYKYLKYKKKYLFLKKYIQYGGNDELSGCIDTNYIGNGNDYFYNRLLIHYQKDYFL